MIIKARKTRPVQVQVSRLRYSRKHPRPAWIDISKPHERCPWCAP